MTLQKFYDDAFFRKYLSAFCNCAPFWSFCTIQLFFYSSRSFVTWHCMFSSALRCFLNEEPKLPDHALRKKCQCSELYRFLFSRIRTEYGEIPSISPYSVRIRENTDQNNAKYGHFSRSDIQGGIKRMLRTIVGKAEHPDKRNFSKLNQPGCFVFLSF